MDVQRGLLTLSGISLSAETGLNTPVPVGNSFVISTVRASASEWRVPYVGSGWQDTSYSYDGNINTYAHTSGNDYMELLMSGTAFCDEIQFRGKYTVSGGGLGVGSVYMDTYYEPFDSWENVYSGSIANDEWIEVTANKNVDKLRIKFLNDFDVCESGYISAVTLSDTSIETLAGTLCKVGLATVSGSYFTDVQATRAASGCDTVVEWQVIYGDEFTVQSGVLSCDDTVVTVSAAITPIDYDKSFIVHTNTTNQEYGSRGVFEATFTSGYAIFNRYTGASGDINSINWYVVEMSGASVQNHLSVLDSNTITTEIDVVDRTKAFLIYSYRTDAESSPDQLFSRGIISSVSGITFDTYQEIGYQYITSFVVEHPDIYVQYGTTTFSGVSDTITLAQIANVDKTFLSVPQFGNAYCDVGIDGALYWAYNTHKLFEDGSEQKITIQRGDNEGSLYASYFVVGPPTSGATVTTSACTEIGLSSFKANGNITDDGNLPITRRGFCYRKSAFGTPTIEDYVSYEDGEFGTGAYSIDVASLNPSTDIRLRAYAVNLHGVSYGSIVTCTTDVIEMAEFMGKNYENIFSVNKYKTPRI